MKKEVVKILHNSLQSTEIKNDHFWKPIYSHMHAHTQTRSDPYTRTEIIREDSERTTEKKEEKKTDSCFGVSFPFHLLKKSNKTYKAHTHGSIWNGFFFLSIWSSTFLGISFCHARVHRRILRELTIVFFSLFRETRIDFSLCRFYSFFLSLSLAI